MYATPAQIADLQKGQLDAFYAVSQTLFGAAEKLVHLNLAASRAVLQESAEATNSLFGIKDVQEFVSVSGGLAQPALEKVVSYSRNVYNIASGASSELSKIVEAQIAEGNRKVAEVIDFAAKNAPAGSEPAVSMLRSAVAASNTAFDTVSKAAKQATDWAESNLNAAAAVANDAVKVKAKKVA